MPTLTQLQYLVAVDRHRHFGRAARACHVSQPSLSMQLQKAEEELGVVVFDRDKKPILPTDKGKLVIEQAKLILREHARLLHLSRDIAGEVSGDYHLGVIPTLAPYLVPLFLADFARLYPKVTLWIDELKTSEIIRRLNEDSLDAGLLATPLLEQTLHERPLFYEPFYLYTNPDHPLARQAIVKEADLDGKELWLLQDGHCFRHQVLSFCSTGARPSPAMGGVHFEGGNFETLRGIIRKAGGYTLFPHLFIANLSAAERKAAVRPLQDPAPSRAISLVHRRDHWKEGTSAALATTLQQALPKELLNLAMAQIMILPAQ